MMLNILMTFAQYEREIIAERIRDKVAAAKKRGKNCGGFPILGYDTDPTTKRLIVNEKEAETVRLVFRSWRIRKSVTPFRNTQGNRQKRF